MTATAVARRPTVSEKRPVRRRPRIRGWAWLVFALALVPRLWGIDWQLPAALYFDELKHVSWAAAQADRRPLSRTDFRNPSLYRRLLEAEYRLAGLVYRDEDDARTAALRLLIARVTSAVLGAGAVALTALAAARLFSLGGGLVAGLALGLSLLHVNISHLAVNDAAASFFLAAGLLFGVRALVRPGPRDFLLAGLAAGLAAAAKYNYGAILLLPLGVAGIGDASASLRVALGGAGSRLIGLTLLGGLAGFVVGMPEVLWAPAAVAEGIFEQARLGGSPQIGQPTEPVPWLYAATVGHGIGVVTAGAALVGAVWMVRAWPWRAAALLASPLICLVVMLGNEFFAARFAGPVLPFVALFAAVGVAWLWARPLAAWWRGAAVGLVIGAIAVPSGLNVLHHDRLATTPDTRVLAESWVRRQAGSASVAAQTFSLPAAWGGSERLRGLRVRRFESLRDPDALARVACDGARYVLVAAFSADRQPSVGDRATGYDVLAREASLVETFSPFWEGRAAPIDPDNMAIPFWSLDAFARPGSLIEVYQLSEDGRTLCRSTSR